MRVPGWLFVLGVVVLVMATGLLSVLAFAVAREIALDTAEAGITLGSVADFVRQPVTTIATAQTVALPPTVTTQPASGVNSTHAEPTTVGAGDVAQSVTPEPGATLDPLEQYIWDDPRRFTMLLMGVDQRSAVNEPGPFRTDTMMVVSVDPVRKTAGVLSIPRDLWVSIPGFDSGRINTANMIGDARAYPGGGPALAAEAIRQNLGINVSRHILINFEVFTAVVDTVAPDGVEVCVDEVIDDPDYPDAGFGTIHVHFDPGCQRLDAEHLLQYARTRATFGGDFDRARRQQEVLKAVQSEVLSAGGVVNFITEIPALWNQLTGSFKTNLSLDEILRLGVLAQGIERDDVRFGVIDNLYVDLGTTSTGDQVLIPKYNSIRFLIQQVFNPPEEELTLADLRVRAEQENAPVVVLNNTDIAGLAGQTRDWLLGRGVQIERIGNTPPEFPGRDSTRIRDYTDNPWTARYLAQLMGLPPERIEPGADGLVAAGIAVIIGTDIQPLLAGDA